MISLLAEFLKYRTNLWLCAALSTLQIFLAFSLCLIVTPHVDLATAKHLLHNFEYWFLIANVLVNTFSGIVRDAENITAWEYALAVTASYVASLLGNLLYLIFDSYMAKGRRVKMIKLGILFFAFLNDIRVIVWLQFQWAPLDPVLIYNQLFISTQFTLMLFRIKFIVSVFRDNIILLKQKVAIKTHDNSEEQRYNSDYSLGTSLHTTVASQTLAGQTIHLCPTHPFAALFFNHSSKCRKCHQSLSLQPFLKQFCASFSSMLAAESWAYGWGWTQIVLTVLSVFLACPFFDRTVAKDAICAFDFWFLLSYVVASVCSGLFTDLQDETYMSKHSNSSIAASFFAFLILVSLVFSSHFSLLTFYFSLLSFRFSGGTRSAGRRLAWRQEN